MTDVSELIAKLEKATGPSRDLDLELWWWCKASHSGQPMEPDYKAHNLKMNDAPHYTSSIDAALTLVPERWGWCINTYRKKAFARVESPDFKCKIWHAGGQDTRDVTSGTEHDAKAQTPAIALCIASLRARQREG